jgi:hypothetical protein
MVLNEEIIDKVNERTLWFNICCEMGAVCDALEVTTKDKHFKKEFAKRAKVFKSLAKVYHGKA